MSKLTVGDLLKEKSLELSQVQGEKGFDRAVKVPEINRLGLALAGHLAYFAAERIHVLGITEYSYLETLSAQRRQEIFKQLFTAFPQIPCIIQTKNPMPFEELTDACRDFSIPLLNSELRTNNFIINLGIFLEEKLAPGITLHGVLIDVFGLGVLILGDSGIGKSECALELLKRGHMFIADDVIEIKHTRGGVLTGSGQELIRHYMEVRGIGIIDIKAIFGIGVILDKTTIELVIKLEES
ncbi:MAG: HPr(Ser) kinase/phosphatase, partial [Elusimicrobiota bacterium]